MKIKCTDERWVDVTEGKKYDAYLDSHEGEDHYVFTDDVDVERLIPVGSSDWVVVEDSTEKAPQFPVGTQCQARTQQNGFWCRWKDITVMGYYEDLIWLSHGDVNFTRELSQVELREKNSERERYVETAAPLLYHSYSPDDKGMEILAGHLYDLGFKLPVRLPDEETK